MKGIVEGGTGNLLRGRVRFLDKNENALTRATFAKANLKVKLFYPFLKESLVGIYNDPERSLWNRS